MLLSYLLARRGLHVVLLEAQADFDRDFRGDTFHSSAMDIMDQLGLTEEMQSLIHSKIPSLKLVTDKETIDFVHFDWLGGAHPYVALIPQKDWLDFMAEKAKGFANFQLIMSANVHGLLEESGEIRGVRFKKEGREYELTATLTVGCDGRGSRLRRAGGLELIKFASPMDVLWFTLPKSEGDCEIDPLAIRFSGGNMLICVSRNDYWQLGWVIMKGTKAEQKAAGLEHFQNELLRVVPQLGERVRQIKDWSQLRALSVQLGRVKKWSKPGLLLLGDAAHVMSPVGGVGINYALMDAVAAANVLTEPLESNSLDPTHLRQVQVKREWPSKVIQFVQSQIQKRVVAQALSEGAAFTLPWPMRIVRALPGLRRLPAWVIGRGFGVERVKHGPKTSPPTST